MIELGSEFSNGPITAASAYSDSPNDLWTGGFDFFLTGASWDVRCTAISKCRDLDIKSAVIIKPGTTDSKNILDKNIKRLSDFCAQKSEKFHILESMPADLAATLEQMRKIFWAEILNINPRRPARVFIDISTCPRYFSLSLMCDALKSGLVSEVVLGYSEGKYPAAKSSYNNFEELSFTDGVLQATPVPGFFGEFEPSRGKFYLVSMGFDGWKTLNLLIRKEPERVAALLASHVGSPNYEHRARAANAALIERFGIEERQMIKATGGDAVEAWRKITEENLENFNTENVYYLCSGNKSHSVALALRAIVKDAATLLYNRPARHLPVNIRFSGIYWRYSIKPSTGTIFG